MRCRSGKRKTDGGGGGGEKMEGDLVGNEFNCVDVLNCVGPWHTEYNNFKRQNHTT